MFPLFFVLSKIKLFFAIKHIWGVVFCMDWIMLLWGQTIITSTISQYQQDLPRCLILLMNLTDEEAHHLLSRCTY